MFVYLSTSKNVSIIYRSDLHNLEARKNSKKIQTVCTEIPTNSNTTRPQVKINA